MSIDDRARAAAADVLERASARPIPSLGELEPAMPPRRRPIYAAAAVLIILGLAVVVTRDGDNARTVTTLPTPPSVEATTWSPAGLGVSVAVPSTWQGRGPAAGFRASIGEPDHDAYALADRLRNVEDLDVDAVGSNRAADLQAFGATDISTDVVEIGGRRAAMLRYRLPAPEPGVTSVVTEYALVDGDWFFLVAVGEQEPVDRSDVTAWVGSSIRLRPLTADDVAFSMPLEHPSALLPVPAGVDAERWAPDGLGATLQVPATWQDMASGPAGFDHAIQPPGGGPTVMASRITADEAADREDFLEGIGADIESTLDTTVDGHAARAIRYWLATRGYPLRVHLDVEYVIDTGNGDALVITMVENDGGEDHSALLRWVRSTINLG